MFRRTQFFFLACAVVVLAFSSAAFGQSATIEGTVTHKKADGSTAPLEGATVEAFRSDQKTSAPPVTTGKRGEFVFLALQPGGVYILSISAPGAEPTFLPNVKAGTSGLKFELKPGDGRRLTPEEVREAATIAGNSGQMTEEQKKAQAEQEKKRAEVEAKNKQIESETKIIQASLKDGNDAFAAKNWDLAVAKYDEGIAANPTYGGSAPVLMNNRGAALRERAVATYNANVRSTDAGAKVAAFAKVKADLGEAAETHHKAWTLLKAAPASEITGPVKDAQIATAIRGASDTFRLMALTEQVDDTKLAFAKEILVEYQNVETDPIKKESSKLILADLYRVSADMDNAVAEYRKVLETSPDNLDGMVGLGLSLVNAGFINDNKEQLQEGANMLQKFASAAPDTHKYKKDATEAIEMLKTEQKITPQKVTPARRRGN
jgi:tetratricopeptide (TPR) repeat protein